MAASDHPIAPAAHERSQVAIAIALTAECIERLYRLRQNRPIVLYGASDFERIVAKRSLHVALGLIACVRECQQGDEQRTGLIHGQTFEIDQAHAHDNSLRGD